MSVRNKLLAGLKPLGIACALTFGLAPAANATILSNHLTFDGPVDVGGFPTQGGGEDRLQDDSLSAIINSMQRRVGKRIRLRVLRGEEIIVADFRLRDLI